MSTLIVFPGQGSQTVGMGKDFYDNFSAARDVFYEVEEALQEKITSVIFDGPVETLNLTRYTQPALMAVSLAIVRVIESELGRPITDIGTMMAGHSLGEYTALCAAGALSLHDTAQLLRIRGDAMQEAVPAGQGSMAAVLGLSLEAVETVLNEGGYGSACVVANDNAPGQVVVSGQAEVMTQVHEKMLEAGARRVVMLPVSAPFHSPLMVPAAEVMETALGERQVHPLTAPIIANVTANLVHDCEVVRALLVQQVTGRVRWRESMLGAAQHGVTNILEIGAGKVLSGLAKRIVPQMALENVSVLAEFEACLEQTF